MRKRLHAVVLPAALLLVSAMTLGGQTPTTPQPDRWARVRFLLGSWEGTTEGQPGKGTVSRSYQFVLRERYIEVRNTSTYLPNEKNPKGEVHEDLGFISHDRARNRLVLRQFHVEGFVNQYVEDPPEPPGHLVFTSEAIENIPAGWRARETHIVHSADDFEEIFELAQSSKPFEVYSRSRFKRIKPPRALAQRPSPATSVPPSLVIPAVASPEHPPSTTRALSDTPASSHR